MNIPPIYVSNTMVDLIKRVQQVIVELNTNVLKVGDVVPSDGNTSGGSFSIQKLDSIANSFNGTANTFALTANGYSVTPSQSEKLLISLNGVLQEPNVAFTVSGSDIVFVEPPETGMEFYGLILGAPLDANNHITVASANISGNLVVGGVVTLANTQNVLAGNGALITSILLANNATYAFGKSENALNVNSAANFTGNLTGDVTSVGMATTLGAGVVLDTHVNASANIAWSKINKAGSSLGDLGDVSLGSPSANQVLTWNGSAWTSANAAEGGSGPHTLLSNTHTDTTNAAATAGDIIIAAGDPVKWQRLALGSNGHVLTSNGSVPVWQEAAAGPGGSEPTQYDAGNSGAAKTIDWANGPNQKLTLNAVCTLAFANGEAGAHYTLLVMQDATGGWTIDEWPELVIWSAGIIPGITPTPGAKELIAFYCDGTEYVGAGAFPESRGSAAAYMSADTVVNDSTETVIQLDGESWDIGSYHSLVTDIHKMVVPSGQGGTYYVVGQVGFGSEVVGTIVARLYKNGTKIAEVSAYTPGNPSPLNDFTQVSCFASLAAGDYVELRAYYKANVGAPIGGTGAPVIGGSASTFLQVGRVA